MAKKTNTPPPVQDYPLVAVDTGSSCFKAMAAEPLPNGALRILGVEQTTKFACMNRGQITNTSSAGYMIAEIMRFLSNRIGLVNEVLPAAYTSIGGASMGVTSVSSRRCPGVSSSVHAQLKSMREECESKIQRARPDLDLETVSLIPAYFELDNERYPVDLEPGVRAKNILGVYSAFYATRQVKESVYASFERSSKQLNASFARPQALLEALASEEDEQMGLAIVDFGAETTTVTVYKDGVYLKNRVIPIGGKHITMDISQQGISLEHAEKLKLAYGYASASFLSSNPTFRIPSATGGDPVRLPLQMLTNIISSRLDEILDGVMKVLHDYEDTISVVYITGGASRLRGLDKYMASSTTIPVLYGSHADWLQDGTPQEWYGPEYSALVGTILLGKKHSDASVPPEKPTKFENARNVITTGVLNLFSGQDE